MTQAPALAAPSAYRARRVAVSALSVAERSAMSALYLSCYAGTSDALFQHDLNAKDEAIVLRHDTHGLVGFTTVQVYPWRWRGEPVRVVYSGDTVVQPAHWGQQTLALAWVENMGRLLAEPGAPPLYWLLLVKGHRTYRYLSAFTHRFHPHWAQAHPDWRALADELAQARFGGSYLPAQGVVRFAQSHGHLRPHLAEPSDAERAKDATAHFLARNPGFRQGDELVCLCPLALDNLKPLAARVARRVQGGGARHFLHG
ncbi:MAG: hypothetical protein Q4G71_04015 [Pseudomonadota bacterium]|nr:hypothetical protein [Pseudomonadota bacterium]